MRSPVTEATSSAASEPVTVVVQLNDGGSWEVELPITRKSRARRSTRSVELHICGLPTPARAS